MSFLSFRDQIYQWTLDSDQNLFKQVNQLTQYILDTEKAINQSIVMTKANLNQNSTILNNNFNHYLRLSENKFTENKIAQAKRNNEEENKKKQQMNVQPKSKIDIFKEALNISLKNLQIKEEDKQADNVSVSELSLSQAIFKNARLPPYFGSKQFRAQKFLNLFYEQDLLESVLSRKQLQSISNQPLSSPSQDFSSNNQNNLAPPPSLQSLNIGGLNNFSNQNNGLLLPPPPLGLNLPPPPSISGVIPPPPSLGLGLPPPPSLTGLLPPAPPLGNMLGGLPQPPVVPPSPKIVIDEKDENKDLLQSILSSTRNLEANNSNYQQADRNMQGQSFNIQPQPIREQQQFQKPSINQNVNKPLSFQQQLALKLKLGKDYKAPKINAVDNSQKASVQNVNQRKQENNYRQSTNLQNIISGLGTNNLSKTTANKQEKQNSNVADQQEQQQNAIFASTKRKSTLSGLSNFQSSKLNIQNKQADLVMSRSTFNEDTLFKKKNVFSKQTLMPSKAVEKPAQTEDKKPNRKSALFNQDSDEQEDNFTFKKKTTNKNQKFQHKKDEEQNSQQKSKTSAAGLSKKTQEPKPTEQKKKPVNKLFGGDSDEQQDVFAKKKPFVKKQSGNSATNIQSPSKNSSQQILKTTTQSPKKATSSNPLGKPATKKSSLFNDEQEEDDFTFKPKPKPVKKQIQKQEEQEKPLVQQKPLQKQVVDKKQIKKQKNALFSTITEEQNENGSIISIPQKQIKPFTVVPQAQDNSFEHKTQEEQQQSQQAKKMKRIARMGGQGMMGMAQLIPKGMNITKPSQTKQQQRLAKQNQRIRSQQQQISKQEQRKARQQQEKRRAQQEQQKLQGQNVDNNIQKQEQKQKKGQNKIQQRVLDPLEILIKQRIIDIRPTQVRKLDPLQALIKEQILDKKPIQQTLVKQQQAPKSAQSKLDQASPISKKPIQNISQNTENKQQTQPSGQGLSLRRKKNKSKRTNEDLFNQNQQQKSANNTTNVIKTQAQTKIVSNNIANNKSSEANTIKSQTQSKQQQSSSVKSNPLISKNPLKPTSNPLSQTSNPSNPLSQTGKTQKQTYIQKMSRMSTAGMSMPGMMPGMGLGPLIPKGMIITKPSQAKKMEQQAIQRLKHQEQQRKLRQQQQAQQQIQNQRIEKQKQILQAQRQQQSLQAKKLQEQQKRLNQQKLQNQRLLLAQQQQQLMRKQQYQQELIKHQRRVALQYQQQKKRKLEQQKQFLEAQRQRVQNQNKLKNNLPSITVPVPEIKKQTSNPLGTKTKASGPLDIPKLPPKVSPLGLPITGKSPLGGSLTTNQKPSLNVPVMPQINNTKDPKKSGKKSLFDEDEQDMSFGKKKQSGFGSIKPPAINPPKQVKKGSLFDGDDDDEGFGFSKKPKKTIASKSKKGLFDDDDDDQGFGFGKKAAKKQDIKQAIQPPQINEPARMQIKNNNPPQKKGLFSNDSDDDNSMQTGNKKITQQQPTAAKTLKVQPPVISKKSSSPQAKILDNKKTKKGLFNDSDSQDDKGFGKKKSPALTTNNPIQKQPQMSKNMVKAPIINTTAPQSNNTLKNKPATNNKKGLFNESDSDEQDVFAKKKNSNSSNLGGLSDKRQVQVNQPLIPTPINNPNKPLIPSSSGNGPLGLGSKTTNPLGGTGPLSGSTAQSIQPVQVKSPPPQKQVIQSTQQKKRNIFEQSQQQNDSPIIPTKKSMPQPQAPQQQNAKKKGLMSQDSQGQQKPQVQRPMNIQPVVIQQKVQQREPAMQQASSSSNNRKLFDSSQDSEDEQMLRKKQAAKNKLKKLL